MAKAVIVKAEMIYRNGAQAHMVTYASGQVRFYPIDKTPASVAAWLEAHATPREFLAPMVIAPAPLVVVEAPTATIAPVETVTAELVPVEAETTAEAPVNVPMVYFGLTGREAAELAEDAVTVAKTVIKVGKSVGKVASALIAAAPTMAQIAGTVFEAVLDGINAAYIVLRAILVHLIWWAQDHAGAVKAGWLSVIRVSVGAALTIARTVTALFLVSIAGAVKGARIAVKAGKATARECAAGWQMRRDILAEDAA